GSSRSRLFQGPGVMSSPDVARAGVEGLLAGKAIVIPGWRNKLVSWGAGLGPRTLAARIAGRFHGTASANARTTTQVVSALGARLGGADQNCCASVDSWRASVEAAPLEITWATSSKYAVPTSRWWRVAV